MGSVTLCSAPISKLWKSFETGCSRQLLKKSGSLCSFKGRHMSMQVFRVSNLRAEGLGFKG